MLKKDNTIQQQQNVATATHQISIKISFRRDQQDQVMRLDQCEDVIVRDIFKETT